MTKQSLRWDMSGFSTEERNQLIDEILAEAGQETTLVKDTAQIEALQDYLESHEDPQLATEESPQFLEAGDPESILIILETTLILIESGRVSKEVYQIWEKRKKMDENIERVPESEVVSNLDGNGGE